MDDRPSQTKTAHVMRKLALLIMTVIFCSGCHSVKYEWFPDNESTDPYKKIKYFQIKNNMHTAHETLLNTLSQLGFSPSNILDIGACVGNWGEYAHSVFPQSKITMVEPIEYTGLKRFENNDNFLVINKLLDEEPQIRNWYEKQNSGDSFFKERTSIFRSVKPIEKQSTTLDIELKDHFPSGPELIKIDTQGSEISILKGGTETLKNNEVILMEMPLAGQYNLGAPSFIEYIKYMYEIGYEGLDVLVKYTAMREEQPFFSQQIDFVFAKKDHWLFEMQQKAINYYGSDPESTNRNLAKIKIKMASADSPEGIAKINDQLVKILPN